MRQESNLAGGRARNRHASEWEMARVGTRDTTTAMWGPAHLLGCSRLRLNILFVAWALPYPPTGRIGILNSRDRGDFTLWVGEGNNGAVRSGGTCRLFNEIAPRDKSNGGTSLCHLLSAVSKTHLLQVPDAPGPQPPWIGGVHNLFGSISPAQLVLRQPAIANGNEGLRLGAAHASFASGGGIPRPRWQGMADPCRRGCSTSQRR